MGVIAPRVVALGGGHGLAATLGALRLLTPHLTAIVTVADDGGSSGRIRRELPAIPPGDLRMALAALAGADDWGRTWGSLLQHRFGGSGALAGHPVGNLIITGLAEMTGDTVEALDLTARMLGAVGRVLPMSTVPLEIVAEVAGIDEDPASTTRIRGQVAVASTPGRVVSVSVVPEAPPACPEAVQAVLDADYIILGPGSWFTSVLPHFFVPELAQALATTAARRVVTVNLAPQVGETDGFSPEAHLDVFCAHAPSVQVDVVVADESAVTDARRLMATVNRIGAELVLEPVAAPDGSPRHDPQLLARAFAGIFGVTADEFGRKSDGSAARSDTSSRR